MASIDSMQTARMFDREKVYTGSDINAALERVAVTGQYKPADPANIMVTGSTVAYDAKVTGGRFFYRPEEGEKCACKSEAPAEPAKAQYDSASAAFFAGFMMGAYDRMYGDKL